MMRVILISASLLGLFSVIIAAMGNHLLGHTLNAQHAEQFILALGYQQRYSILLVALSLFGLHQKQNRLLNLSCLALLVGSLLFCATLYLSAFQNLSLLRYGTPIGGSLLILGWLLLLFFAVFYKKSEKALP